MEATVLAEENATLKGLLDELAAEKSRLSSEAERLSSEREKYRELYLKLLEQYHRLEQGLRAQKSEKTPANEAQLTLQILATLLQDPEKQGESPPEPLPVQETKVAEHTRQKPSGRKPLPANLPRVVITVMPPEVEEQGTDAFRRIGEEISEVIERRPASVVIVRTERPKFVHKGAEPNAPTQVLVAEPLELPIPRGLCGPGMLAELVVRRFQDHLPYHRLEGIYARDGLDLSRSTMCSQVMQLADLVDPLIRAMWADMLNAPFICADATGVLVQAPEKCTKGHFWVAAAPQLHVMMDFSRKHDKQTVDRRFNGYQGYMVVDAHVVYDHLYKDERIKEVACWAHTRRYFFKSMSTEPELSREALALINGLFAIERELKDKPPQQRQLVRQQRSLPIVDRFFEWCQTRRQHALEETPLFKGLRYAQNQEIALRRFLTDGRLPMDNNWSERELRRQAVGRKNWLFVGSDDGGKANATFTSLLASCQLHGIEPWSYLRDLFCLFPGWPKHDVLRLAPAYWAETMQTQKAQDALDQNLIRFAMLQLDKAEGRDAHGGESLPPAV